MQHPLKVRGNGLSGKATLSLIFTFYAPVFLWSLVVSAVPAVKGRFRLALLPIAVPILAMFLIVSLNEYQVTLTEDTIVLSWLGIPLRKLAVAQLRLFCVAGKGDSMLCLTTRSIEEMATLEERLMLRNPFTKHELPFLKKHANWQDILADKYLDRIRNNPLGVFRDSQVAYLFLDPVVQYQIRKLYPQLPYKNLAGIKPYGNDPCMDKSAVPNFSLEAPYFVELQEDAILLRNKKEVKGTFPLEKVKTIVRIDVFRYEKYAQHHTRAFVLSVYTAEEMAQKVTAPTDSSLLRAYRCAENAAKRWTIKQKDFCNLPCTAEMAEFLRAHCPDAQWIDLTGSWLTNTN